MSQTSRRLTRRLLFQKLFVLGYNKITDEKFFDFFYQDDITSIDEKYFEEMQNLIIEKEDILISLVEKYAPKFNIEKMSLLFIIPLYIALTEMFFLQEEIPAKVSINEAIELSKKYGDGTTKNLVNGILNNILTDYDNLKTYIKEGPFESKFSFFK
ncbi:MAG: transcription antitermination protein NusB [Candidatus Gracilibacteria bacterium]|nr:transcription antitermination protein NusB [Candidatus Gracilibacteria bacterium]